MIERADIDCFNEIAVQIKNLLASVHKYNPTAKIDVAACVGKDQKVECGLFLLDEGAIADNPESAAGTDGKSNAYKEWIGKGFAAGVKIDGADLYSRSEIMALIKEKAL